MTDPKDPPRLFQVEAGAPERVRRVLEESRADVASDAELVSLEARLAPMLWPGAPPAAGPSTAPATIAKATTLGALKVAAVTAALAGAAGVWVNVNRSTGNEARSVSAHEPAAPKSEPQSAPSPVEAIAPAPPEKENGDPSAAAPQPRRSRDVDAADSVSETDLLNQARAALATNPGRALSLTEKHRGRFTKSVLVQEREVIAIEALTRLGRRSDATARADRFRTAFPGSAYRSKIDGLVGPR